MDVVKELAAAIGRGPIVVQTETVYGIACLPRHEDIRSVFEVKHRPVSRNLPVIVDSLASARMLGVDVPHVAEHLAEHFWPGGLTLAFGFAPHNARPRWLDAREEVAVRVPAVRELRELATGVGPYLMTSANVHGGDEATTREGATRMFPQLVVFDFGVVSTGAASTLVNTRLDPPVVERVGSVPVEEIVGACPESEFVVRRVG